MTIQLPAQLQPIAEGAGPWSRAWYEWAWRVTQAANTGGGGGGAPTNATYVTLSTDATLTAERVLTAGSGISITDGGAGGPVTIAATGGGGAPTGAQYVTLATDAGLTAERVLTAGAGISITDGGPNGPVTVVNSRPCQTVGASLAFGGSFTDKAQTVVTGQTWVTANTRIAAEVLTPSGTDPDEMYLLDLRPVISDIVVGDGWTVTLYTEPEARGTYTVMCVGY